MHFSGERVNSLNKISWPQPPKFEEKIIKISSLLTHSKWSIEVLRVIRLCVGWWLRPQNDLPYPHYLDLLLPSCVSCALLVVLPDWVTGFHTSTSFSSLPFYSLLTIPVRVSTSSLLRAPCSVQSSSKCPPSSMLQLQSNACNLVRIELVNISWTLTLG